METLGKYLGVNPSVIKLWETGETQPSLSVLKEYSYAFQVSLDDMIRFDLSKIDPGDVHNKYQNIRAILLNPEHQIIWKRKPRQPQK